MSKADKIALLAAGAGAALLWLMRKQKAASGVGAVKRRIYKELSLAQKAGVDFTKKYDELDEKEIKALEKVSSDAGYTETYYKSLKKAYDAVSGIGAAYDVKDADGNTVLTWIEDAAHQADAARELEEREARLAEQCKRIKKSGRSSQMALFGIGALNTRDLLEPELLEYVRMSIDVGDVHRATDEIIESHYPLSIVDGDLENEIVDAVEDWCIDNAVDADSIWEIVTPEDIFWEL